MALPEADGTFVVHLPATAAATVLNMVVCAPPAILASAGLAPGKALELHLAAAGGVLGLRTPARTRVPWSTLSLVAETGGLLPPRLGHGVRQGRRGSRYVPDRDPCRPLAAGAGGAPEGNGPLARGGAVATQTIGAARVPPGGSAELPLPRR